MSSIKIRTQLIADEMEIRLLITHPMENGRNRNPVTGELIPAHYIEQLHVRLNDALIISVNMAGSISKNPFFSFRLKEPTSGIRISVEWTDNQQGKDSAEHII